MSYEIVSLIAMIMGLSGIGLFIYPHLMLALTMDIDELEEPERCNRIVNRFWLAFKIHLSISLSGWIASWILYNYRW